MRKFLKAVFVLMCVLAFSSAAFALSPQDALSARQDSLFYYVMSLDDLNGMLQDIFSPANIEMAASLVPPEEAQVVRLLASFVAQIPARSVVAAFGASNGADGEPVFLQIAASMPPSARPKLDRVADGTASGVEIVSLLLGDAGIMLASGFTPAVQVLDDGSVYYTFSDIVFAAKEDLLLITLSLDGLKASLAALANEENRLELKRRFNSPDFLQIHMDMPAMFAFAEILGEDLVEELGEENIPSAEEFAKIFKAPLEVEMDFSSKPGSFLISTAANIMDALVDTEPYNDLEPANGANLFLAGGGKLLGAMSWGTMSFRAADLKASPEAMRIWNKLISYLGEADITESDVEDMLNGSASLAFGSDATFLGRRVPGGYAALTGREGAAARILGKLMASEKFTQAIPAAPLKIDGWDEVFVVDPSMVPVPLLFGRVEDTFFVGIVDSASLNKAPEVPGEFAAMLEEPLFAAGAVDFAGIWNWLRQEAGDPESLLSVMITGESGEDGAVLKSIIDEVLSAELSVPLMKIWASELDTGFMEFSVTEIPGEKRLLPKLVQLVQTFIQMENASMEEIDSYFDGAPEVEEGDGPVIEVVP